MKSTFYSNMATVALTMWLGVAAGTANAGVLSMSTPWEGNASEGYTAYFGRADIEATFDDWLTFSIPADSSGNGKANVIGLAGENITFTKFTLTESNIGTVSGATGGSTSALTFNGGAAPGRYKLNVAGTRTGTYGSYAGNIGIAPVNVSAIPEPETYAMMLAGLGLLGFSARRRINNV